MRVRAARVGLREIGELTMRLVEALETDGGRVNERGEEDEEGLGPEAM